MAKLIVRGLETNVEVWNKSAVQVLVALHGFTGSTATWRNLANKLPNVRIVAIDCIGHGKTAVPKEECRFSMEEQIQDIEEVVSQLHVEKFSLIGYSMGGRIALSYAVAYPDRINKLILESASPGLRTENERIERRQSDYLLAEKIERNGITSFVDAWEKIALFDSQIRLPVDVQQAIRKERLAQSEAGLAGSLRGIGTGMQPSNWPYLAGLDVPVLLITGSMDEKFCRIASEMQALLRNAQHVTVNDVGHAIHVENPSEFATIVEKYIM